MLRTYIQNDPYTFGQPADISAPLAGNLIDVRRYFIYRVLLYSDDFQIFVGEKGSADGCYMLPISLPVGIREFLDDMRGLSITPPGVSSDIIIRAIIPDLIEATKSVIEINDRNRENLTAFFDIVDTQRTMRVSHTLYMSEVQLQTSRAMLHIREL